MQKLQYENLQAQISSSSSGTTTSREFSGAGQLRKRKSGKDATGDETSASSEVTEKTSTVGPIPFSSGILGVLVAISVGSSLLSFYVTKKIYQ